MCGRLLCRVSQAREALSIRRIDDRCQPYCLAARTGVGFEMYGDWQVRVQTLQPTEWGNARWLTFELGPPGQIHEIPEK